MYGAGEVRRKIHDAFDVWARQSKLTFEEQYNPEADIQVLFTRYI